MLWRLGAGTDIHLSTATLRRYDEAPYHMIGFFMSTLVPGTDLSGDPTFAELLERVRGADVTAFERQEAPSNPWWKWSIRNAPRGHLLFPVSVPMRIIGGAGLALPNLDTEW
jgi:hypothetical protein